MRSGPGSECGATRRTWRRSGLRALIGLAFPWLAWAAPAAAQDGSGLAAQCVGGTALVREYCLRVAEAMEVLEPRIAVVASGGNPVPGTASTLGMRLGTFPRISLGARLTATHVEVGGIERATDADEQGFFVPSLNLDGSVGIFSGISLAPTIGGFGSLDLLASAGKVLLPEGEGFESSPMSWGAGLRLGVLRESFTAPGLSVSAMYRRLGDIEFGTPALGATDAFFVLEDVSGWSLRGAVSKRLLGFGLTAGAGFDQFSGEARASVSDPTSLGLAIPLSADDVESSRLTVFGNLSYTLLILHLVGEVGWQSGGDEVASLPGDRIEKAGLYGGLALRLSL